MLALRSVLAIPGSDAETMVAARQCAADAVVLDLAMPALHRERTGARAIVAEAIEAIGATGRPAIVRVSSARSGELEADIAAAVGSRLAAVVLSGTEEPQDARDADVLLRKYEMQRQLAPGAVRLIPEIDAAPAIQALPSILDAVDRHTAVAVNPARLHDDLALGRGLHEIHDHLMAMVAVAARAAELPWILGTFDAEQGWIEAARAHEFGASGAVIHSDAAARGVNSLFEPDAAAVESARAVVEEWERIRESGDDFTSVAFRGDEALLVDRRAVRHARFVLARADAIVSRERVK